MYKQLRIPEKASIEPPVFLKNDKHFTEEIINDFYDFICGKYPPKPTST